MKKKNKTNNLNVSLIRRLGAILYDTLILLTLLILISFIISILFNISPKHPLFFIYQTCIYSISFLFYGWFWTHGGQTLGMKTWKFKITAIDGSRVNWTKAIVRFIVAIISWLFLGIGYIWSIFDSKKRTWHDIASKTQLVRI